MYCIVYFIDFVLEEDLFSLLYINNVLFVLFIK